MYKLKNVQNKNYVLNLIPKIRKVILGNAKGDSTI